MKYTVIKCRLDAGRDPSVWRPWESKIRKFLRDNAGPGKVPKEELHPGEPLFRWSVKFVERINALWQFMHYSVMIADPVVATMFALKFSEYLDG